MSDVAPVMLSLVKDRRGRVIGFDRLNFLSTKERKEGVSVPAGFHLD
jgi:hypothetical protein